MIGDTVTLNEVEMKIVKWLANARYTHNRDNGIVDRKVGNQSALETDLQGLAAEFAYAKMFGFYPDLSLGVKPADITDPYGFTYDVKTTKYENGHLLAGSHKTLDDVDYYVLMVGEAPTFTYKGEVCAVDLIKPENLKSLGGFKPAYCLTQKEIVELNEL